MHARTHLQDPEKISAHECVFDLFDDARSRFDVHFYLVAILLNILGSYFFIHLGFNLEQGGGQTYAVNQMMFN